MSSSSVRSPSAIAWSSDSPARRASARARPRASRSRCSSSRAPSSSRSDFGRERRRPLDQAGVRRARFGGSRAEFVHRLARVRQPPLRVGEALVGLALLVLQPADLRRSASACRASSVARSSSALTALERDDVGLARQARRLLGRARQLRLVADDLLLLAVLLGRGARRCAVVACAIASSRLLGLLDEPRRALRARPPPARAAP